MMTETVVTVENTSPNNNAAKSTGSSGRIQFNLEYFKTVPGLLKLAQLVLGILCLALASPAWIGGTRYFLFAASVSFISTIIWSFVYLLGIREALNLPIDWLLSELVNTCIDTVLYAIGFLVQIIVWINPPVHSFQGVNIAAGVFGILATVAYGYGAMLLHRDWKSSRTN